LRRRSRRSAHRLSRFRYRHDCVQQRRLESCAKIGGFRKSRGRFGEGSQSNQADEVKQVVTLPYHPSSVVIHFEGPKGPELTIVPQPSDLLRYHLACAQYCNFTDQRRPTMSSHKETSVRHDKVRVRGGEPGRLDKELAHRRQLCASARVVNHALSLWPNIDKEASPSLSSMGQS
jgi:hypothetical protein